MTRLTASLLASAALLSLGACTTPVDPDAGPTMAERVAALPENGEISDGDTFTCRRVQITGTRMYERVCARDSEWAEQADRTEAVNAIGAADRSQVRPFDPPGT